MERSPYTIAFDNIRMLSPGSELSRGDCSAIFHAICKMLDYNDEQEKQFIETLAAYKMTDEEAELFVNYHIKNYLKTSE